MTAAFPVRTYLARCGCLVVVCVACLLSMGCDSEIEDFPTNDVYALTLASRSGSATQAAREDVAVAVRALFGTANEPGWPAEHLSSIDAGQLLNPDRLLRASGAVYSDKGDRHFGLYREHCVACHGIAGDGVGPTSRFQSPYPRNFRHGIFKWKSTRREAKPTRGDLMAVLEHGLRGSAMPAFATVPDEDLSALVDYVIFLSIRGEVEREAMFASLDELGYEATAPKESEYQFRIDENGLVMNEAAGLLIETLNRVVDRWVDAESAVMEVLPMRQLDEGSQEHQASVDRGKEIFHGQIANCAGCHGQGGIGDLPTLDYDDWSKEYSTRLGLAPTDRDDMRPFKQAGALPPKPISPRRLAGGVIRGGSDAATLYRRISQGIAGTPMPAVKISSEPSGVGLSVDQAWDLVRYVQSIAVIQEDAR
ncbi:MAG: cytochrome c [Planctomycetota bacterium]